MWGEQQVAEVVKNTSDVVWPVLHGAWGEYGQVQATLEEMGIPYIGTPPASAQLASNKLL